MKDANNIFERVAEQLEQDRKLAYKDNPVSTKYFRLSNSTDLNVIGRQYPQTDYINLGVAHSLKFHELHINPIDFKKIELYKSSKITDNISTAALSAHAFILSKRALNVFKQFNLGEHKIYSATIFLKGATILHKGVAHDYGVLHFTNDLQSELDFHNSKFYVANILGSYEFDISIDNKDDYEKKRQLVKNAEYPGTEKWWSVRLKYGVFTNGKETRTPDLFTVFSSSENPYISSELAQAIVNNELTGFQLDRIYNL
jgi:hypothetical protein